MKMRTRFATLRWHIAHINHRRSFEEWELSNWMDEMNSDEAPQPTVLGTHVCALIDDWLFIPINLLTGFHVWTWTSVGFVEPDPSDFDQHGNLKY